jgi:hypothetical protein
MRAGLCGLAALGAAIAATAPALALDNEQFCRAMTETARINKADVGRWIDRNTRDDGIDVLCDIRTMNHKRFVRFGSGSEGAAWKQRKEKEWNSIACNSEILREAVEAGWLIASTITAASGERIVVVATCPK